MGLFNFSKKKKDVLQSAMSSNKKNGVVSKQTSLINSIQSLPIHPDLIDLVWIGDGPKKNFLQQTNNRSSIVDGIRISIRLSSDEEPSLLSVNMPISFENTTERPSYYPSYKELTPEQKGEYWRFLANPYDSSVYIGYVFILYYGLERFLLTDNYEKAIDTILKLRDVHSNSSFQRYSSNAIVLTSILCKRPDILGKFFESLDKDYEFTIDDNLYLLCKYYYELPLTTKDIIRMAKSFEFNNMNYIKKYPDVFEKVLHDNIVKKYGDVGIVPSHFISKNEFRKLPYSQMVIFANVSIDCRETVVPHLLTSFKLKKIVNELLCQTHEDVKVYAAQMRKQGTPLVEKTKTKANDKIKEVPVFDTDIENGLLTEFEANSNNPLNQHFISTQLQDLYYKYRNLSSEYLKKCIFYCEDDIAKLPILQESYRRSEIDSIKKLSAIYSEAEIDKQISQITDFDGQISAFKRLAIIHEKAKNFDEAIAICNSAIVYYDTIGSYDLSREFKQRQAKLELKKEKYR